MSWMRSLRAFAVLHQRRLGALGFQAKAVELPPPFFERHARRPQLVERALTRRRRDRGRAWRARASVLRRLADLPHVGRREQQPQIAALAELVDVDEPRSQFGPAGRFLALELARSLFVRRQLRRDLRPVGRDLPQFLGFDLPIDLQLAQVAEQRPLLRGERVRFALQRLQTLGRAPRQRLGARAVRRLREQRRRQGYDHDDREAAV